MVDNNSEEDYTLRNKLKEKKKYNKQKKLKM